MTPEIKEGTAAEAALFLAKIPEFSDAYPPEEYHRRLYAKPHLVLVAWVAGEAVGCKVGYALDNNLFYSWMGAVLPNWRRHGIAEELALKQEAWARNQGYTAVRFKTRNNCRAMLYFALARDFNIIKVEPRETVALNRIWLEKGLEVKS